MSEDHFEDRHRALREPKTTRIQRQESPGKPGVDATWTQVDMHALMAFDAITAPLVDDLVAAVREERRWEDMLAAERGAQMRGHLLGQLIDARRVRRVALAALDEASRT